MTLPAAPPIYPATAAGWRAMLAPIVKGERGWRAYAVQRGVRSSPKPENLGVFTVGTVRAVKRWQRNHPGLGADGIVGPATSASILLLASKEADEAAGLPGGTTYGYAVHEGVGHLAATNPWTPEGEPPGVDCGPPQRRCLGPPFKMAELLVAFDPWAGLKWAAQLLADRRADYLKRTARYEWKFSPKRALRVAVLAHNAPFLAEQLVRQGHLSTPNALAMWTHKPGGTHYTHAEWSEIYPSLILEFSLGA